MTFHRLLGGLPNLRKNTTIGFKHETPFVEHGSFGNPSTCQEGSNRLVELSRSNVLESKELYNGHFGVWRNSIRPWRLTTHSRWYWQHSMDRSSRRNFQLCRNLDSRRGHFYSERWCNVPLDTSQGDSWNWNNP